MVICKTRRWGSSIGIIIPKDLVNEMRLGENEEINIEINRKSKNVLRELWDWQMPKGKITRERFEELRKELQSKYE